MTPGLTRAGLLARMGVGGAALVVGGAGLAAALPATAGADTLPDGDLAYLRLLIASELLAADFYGRALATGRLGRPLQANLRRALADEQQHYDSLARQLAAAGGTPATADDIDFAYPKGAFGTRASIARLAARLESVVLGAYLGAVQGVATAALQLPLSQAAANEAQHLSVVSAALGKQPIGSAFPPALSIDEVSAVLDGFEG